MLKPSEWDVDNGNVKKKMPSNKLYHNYLPARSTISDKKSLYDKQISELENSGREVTIEQLIQMVENPIKKDKTVFEYIENRIKHLKDTGHIGNASIYKGALNKLKKYTGDADLKFYQMDRLWVMRYREHLIGEGNKPNYYGLLNL